SINVSAEIDGGMTGMLSSAAEVQCPYLIFVEKDVDCASFQSSTVFTSVDATMDASICGDGELPEDGVSRAPAQRTLNDLDWTIGASETKLTDLKLAAQVTFSQEGDASITSGEDMWSMQLCEVFEEVFAVAGRSIIMIACGALLLVAGLLTCLIGLCCCCCCGAKE
ncbi:unnamed protein product, partial [Symbiodinium pilosum]